MTSAAQELRHAAGLSWSRDGDIWTAANAAGRFQVLEFQPNRWTALHFPAAPGCGCGQGARGGAEFDSFDQAAAAAAALAG